MMNTSLPAKIVALAALVALTGCSVVDPCQDAKYDGKGMVPFMDAAYHFHLCVPAHLTRTGRAGAADGRVVFSGFSVPPNTTLISKTLIIVPGAYDEMQGATPFGHFVAGGVTFQRVKVDEGSAGHSTLHIIYTWTTGGQALHFDFTHYAVNPLVFDPDKRPANYDQAAQIKLSEEIMGTFKRSDSGQ